MNKELIKFKLLGKFSNLKNVFLTDSCYNYEELKAKLGKVASSAFEEIVGSYKNTKVGIGGGSSIYTMVNLLKTKPRNIRIYPTALIGRGPEINHIDSSFLTSLLYLKSRPLSKGYSLNFPPLPKTKKDALNFLETVNNIEEVKWLKSLMCEVDCCFIGAGAVIPTGDFDDESSKLGYNFNVLKKNNVIGGINYNWFKSNGEQFGEYFNTISITNLQKMSATPDKQVVLIAGGTHKYLTIEAAIENKMVNVLITDIETATKLLSK